MGQLHLAKLDRGEDVPVLPIDVAAWQQHRLADTMGYLCRSAHGSFPRRGYPKELLLAHEYAKLSSLEIEMLESELLRELAARESSVAKQASALMLSGRRMVEDLDEE
jgi:hypothetical protein